MKQAMTWRKFGLSLVDAGINSAANGVTVIVVDPADFNLTNGLYKLGSVVMVSFIFGVFLFLKTHRLPGVEDA